MLNPLIYVLVAMFGSSAWISTNSVWMQLPLMTPTLPEGWNLPSYLVVIIQLGCIAPLIYTILHKCTNLPIPKAPIILVLMIVCTLTNLALAFFWYKTGTVFGGEHSVALIIIMFFMAMANATTDVLFLPYMSSFHQIYLTAYFVGMGFSALIPSLVALIQGSNNYECERYNSTSPYQAHYTAPKFGIRTYNLIMFGWLCITIVSFIFLHWFRHILEKSSMFNEKSQTNREINGLKPTCADEIDPTPSNDDQNIERIPKTSEESENENDKHGRISIRYWTFLIILLVINAQMNGVIPSISSFATLPYSQQTYHLALTISYGAQPFGGLISMWIRPKSITIFLVLTIITSGFTGIVVLLAAQSPTPLLHHSFWGAFISIVASVGASFGQCYLRSAITAAVRDDSPNDEAKIFWCGVFMQIGSFVGSWIMFPLTNTYHLFKSGNLC
uniref:Riboflavin transporter n=1 Tax=Acrobeloides nanus TaxID=290746 RepID=A0A914E4I9_9BILA